MRSPTQIPRLACLLTSSLTLLAWGGACVTVNVNFPESAVQKATDEYVRELYKARERKSQPATEPSGAPSSQFRLPDLIPQAYADEVLKMSSPSIQAIQRRQIERLDEINREKKAGNLGEDNQGLLSVKTDKKILMMKLEKLVGAENKDREQLFNEVMKLNAVPEAQVRKNFARSFQSGSSPSGTWVQGSDGEWSKKP